MRLQIPQKILFFYKSESKVSFSKKNSKRVHCQRVQKKNKFFFLNMRNRSKKQKKAYELYSL